MKYVHQITQLEKNQNCFVGRNNDIGHLFFNLLFIVLHYIFTIFSFATIDGNILFWMSIILLQYLNKEISKMLRPKMYQIFLFIRGDAM